MFSGRQLFLYQDYSIEWYQQLDGDIQEKVDWVLELVKAVDVIPQKYFKHIEGSDGLYEIRIEYKSNIYRVFCFFDKGNLIILINAFQKKSQKTPLSQIELATRLKKQYFKEKEIQ